MDGRARRSRGLRLGCGLVLVVAGAALGQSTLHVPGQFPTIQAAIDASINGDTVLVADGVYTGPGNRGLDFGGRAITVRSAGGAAACIIDCQGAGRAAVFQNGEVRSSVLQGFTIINGATLPVGGSGGGIRITQASPTIRGCIIRDCASVYYGGGVAVEFGPGTNPLLEGCTIERNRVGVPPGAVIQAGAGGGVYIVGAGLTMVGCVVQDNRTHEGFASIFAAVKFYDAGRGAGLFASNSAVSIADTAFRGNRTGNGGGGDPDPCAFNSAGARGTAGGSGAGLYILGGNAVLRGCWIVDNHTGRGGDGYSCPAGGGRGGAGGDGAGIYHAAGTLELVSCAISANTAGRGGHGGTTGTGTGGAGGDAGRGGGLFSLSPALVKITNATIVGNAVAAGGSGGGGPSGAGASGLAGSGGGVWTSGGPVQIANTILWNNLDPQGQAEAAQLRTLPVASLRYSRVQGLSSIAGPGNSGADPRLADALGRLRPSSGAIDAGDNGALPEWAGTDADGNPRRRNNPGIPDSGLGLPPLVDIGAFEFPVDSCYANCDDSGGSPLLNVGDFVCFQSRFAAGDNYANCDGSTAEPTLNVADFICFMNGFARGCP